MALHTFGHEIVPSQEQIDLEVDALTKCGVPRGEIRGFRAPTLATNATTYAHLRAAGLQYDSSLAVEFTELGIDYPCSILPRRPACSPALSGNAQCMAEPGVP